MSKREPNPFELLKTKEIIAIARWRCQICGVSTLFRLPMSYSWGKGAANLSRWQYLET